jgi:predicted outer membrane repeat protein
MTIEQTTVIDNSAYGGGGIYSVDTLTIRNSRIAGNHATGVNGAGGGIQHFNQSASPSKLTILQSTIDGNDSVSQGGGLWVSGAVATFEMVNSTLYDNSSGATGGGGLYVTSANATLTNVTLSDNESVTTDGDNIENSSNLPATITLRNTLVDGGGCVGAVVDGDGNLEFPGTSCGFDTPSADPGLAALASNGGRTPTMAIAENGPAQNSGVNANCPATDQRGVLRAQFVTCDIGAFEWGALPILDSIAPQSTLALSPTFTLVVNGSNFIPGTPATRVLWDGEALPVTYVSATELRATVAANRIVAGGEVNITVETLVVDGGLSAHTEVFTIVKRDQSINFDELDDRGLEPVNFILNATASSGLEVTFTAAGVCTVNGKSVTLVGEVGVCTITARQAGNESYNPAPDVTWSFDVNDETIREVKLHIPHIFGASTTER